MSVLHELAECFEISEREVCARAGYSPFDVKRILEADASRPARALWIEIASYAGGSRQR